MSSQHLPNLNFQQMNSLANANVSNSPNSSISANVYGSQLTISTSARLAGAIGSLTWNGIEFINQDDHGRELQSASSFDGLGECFNPTEAGSGPDGIGNYSTSQLLGIRASGNVLQTTSQMAFWTQAGQPYPNRCGPHKEFAMAQNATNLSNHKLSKRVTIGFAGIPNVIEYLVTFNVPEKHNSATFEALTGYMTQYFSVFWTYDPKTKSLASLSDGPGEQAIPIIFSTSNRQYAMGIYSPYLPQGKHDYGYGRFNFYSQNTMKWNAVYREYNITPGNYSYRNFVIVGTLDQVKKGMQSLHEHFYPVTTKPPVAPPVVTPKPPVTPPPAPTQGEVKGVIDGISAAAQGSYNISGWACAQFSPQSLSVHLYLGGAAGSGTLIGATTPNGSSEAQVATACSSTGNAYRFSIPLSKDQVVQFGGKKIYVHGISPFGLGNHLLSNSGDFIVPMPPITGIHEFFKGTDYFETASVNEGTKAGFASKGVAFKVYASQASDLVAVYRCYVSSSKDHFVSRHANCEKQTTEGTYGFIYPNPTPGHIPVYRYRNPTTGDHMANTGAAPAGYTQESILGYAPK